MRSEYKQSSQMTQAACDAAARKKFFDMINADWRKQYRYVGDLTIDFPTGEPVGFLYGKSRRAA
jgi:hypothetical protein